MDTLRFGEWLADRRIERALTQEALGASVGVGQSSVGQWEDGSTYPTRKYWVRLADAIGADVEEVQRRIERERPARRIERGAVFHAQMNDMPFEESGLHWFIVSLAGEFVTRVPLRVVYQRIE